MKIINKNIVLSIIVSLVFPVSLIIGEIVGSTFGEILYFIYNVVMNLNMSEFVTLIGKKIVEGITAGYIAGFVNVFLYKYFHFKSTIVIPVILLLISISGCLLSMINNKDYFASILDIISLVMSGYIYIYYLKDKRKLML